MKDQPTTAKAPDTGGPGFWRLLGLLTAVLAMLVFLFAGSYYGWSAMPDGSPEWLQWAGAAIGFMLAVYAVLGFIWFPAEAVFAVVRAKTAAARETGLHPILVGGLFIFVAAVPIVASQLRPAYRPAALQRALAEQAKAAPRPISALERAVASRPPAVAVKPLAPVAVMPPTRVEALVNRLRRLKQARAKSRSRKGNRK